MNTKLSTRLTFGFSLIVFVTVVLIYITANIGIGRQYEEHLKLQQKKTADTIATGLSQQYNLSTGKWNIDYIHGYGMYALNEGYIVKIYDNSGNVIWDAENHDMTLCHKIMDNIITKMKERRPEVKGSFYKYDYDLTNNNTKVGVAKISYYSPYSMNEIDFKFLDALNKLLLVLGVGAVVVAGISGYFLAKYISNPIEKVTDTTRKISEGNYNIEMKNNIKTKELLELKNAVNQMAYNLKNQEMLRKRLVTDVAHELRTPLTNVMSHIELMADGIWEASPERLEICSSELGRISEIIKNLEKLQQIENENMDLCCENVDLIDLIEQCNKAFESKMKEKDISCTVEGESTIACVDISKFTQVLHNLLSNSIKYTENGGKIIWEVYEKGNNKVITITDTGIGIDENDIPFIFERFYRTDISRQRKTGGSGIGLTIVKSIIKAHNGKIEVESKKGKGSKFTITL